MSTIRIFRVYQRILYEKPYTVQSVQTASLMMVGDVISQTFIEKRTLAEINLYRVVKFGSIGVLLGPSLTGWYRFLDKLQFNSQKLVILKKIAIDQAIFAPCAIAAITTLVQLGDGKTMEETKNKLKSDYLTILKTNYSLWPFVQYVNFSYVPLNYRVLVTQFVAVGWNTYLAWKLNNDHHK